MRPIKSYYLVIDENKCQASGACVDILPDFKEKYGGRLMISESNMKQDEVRDAVRGVIEACKAGAISLEEEVK